MKELPASVVADDVLAVVLTRAGRVPAGADEAVAEAGGLVLLAGDDPGPGIDALPSARRVWLAPTVCASGAAARALAPALAGVQLLILPASPDGRDLAPRLAAELDRPLLAGATRCSLDGGAVSADLLRVDGQVVVPVTTHRAAVATLWPGSRGPEPAGQQPDVVTLDLARSEEPAGAPLEARLRELIEPDPSTMELSEASRVFGGGAGLVPAGASPDRARAIFGLLVEVAAALGASAGATRVVTDAGWMGYDRQIGTTGVTLNPELYVALGVSGASQHVGGLGTPTHTASVNTDPSCPMTAMADLGLVADAPSVLVEVARRLGVPVPEEVADLGEPT